MAAANRARLSRRSDGDRRALPGEAAAGMPLRREREDGER